MLFSDRASKDKFLAHCYHRGLTIARRRYYSLSGQEDAIAPGDIVASAILKINKYLKEKKFESEKHAECVFYLCLRSEAKNLRSKFNKNLSLNQPIGSDTTATFEDFIAARLVYPSLEDDERRVSIETAMQCLEKEEKDFVYKAWVQDLGVDAIANQAKKPQKYVKRCLDRAKLKLTRKLFFCTEKC